MHFQQLPTDMPQTTRGSLTRLIQRFEVLQHGAGSNSSHQVLDIKNRRFRNYVKESTCMPLAKAPARKGTLSFLAEHRHVLALPQAEKNSKNVDYSKLQGGMASPEKKQVAPSFELIADQSSLGTGRKTLRASCGMLVDSFISQRRGSPPVAGSGSQTVLDRLHVRKSVDAVLDCSGDACFGLSYEPTQASDEDSTSGPQVNSESVDEIISTQSNMSSLRPEFSHTTGGANTANSSATRRRSKRKQCLPCSATMLAVRTSQTLPTSTNNSKQLNRYSTDILSLLFANANILSDRHEPSCLQNLIGLYETLARQGNMSKPDIAESKAQGMTSLKSRGKTIKSELLGPPFSMLRATFDQASGCWGCQPPTCESTEMEGTWSHQARVFSDHPR
ncbi:uncharacterized protein F5Z01DRAFT_696867 [Emericellopsis atlantica]|uniref:Uncharacterized protein n=1 Tax=Emericellopsis atlantica TaxID=2614577 RepID=A0A9P8CJX4_9HYPO|nr:uncharacterized protein F5Z01DRAFT_696867 [Emericellopsis atlantica]KAG9249778.1 hypothetical protein F5Z01DRAFT_696867 [Emericellopsis atlantica]